MGNSAMIDIVFVLSGLGQVIKKSVPEGTSLRAFCSSVDGWAPNSGATHVLVNSRDGTSGSKDLGYILVEGDEVTLSPREPKNAIPVA